MPRFASRSVLAAPLAGASVALAGPTYFDTTFHPSDWTASTVTNANGVGSTALGTQVLVGGNPTEYMRVQNNVVVSGSGGGVFGFYFRNGATYNPTNSGPITLINYTEDSINLTPGQPGDGQAGGLAILQSGKTYRQQPFLIMPGSSFSTWTANPAPGLVASSFVEVTGTGTIVPTSHPDFSAAGGVLQFGFVRANSGNTSYSTDCGIDNWCVEIVPSPGTAGVVLMGAGVGLRRRR